MRGWKNNLENLLPNVVTRIKIKLLPCPLSATIANIIIQRVDLIISIQNV